MGTNAARGQSGEYVTGTKAARGGSGEYETKSLSDRGFIDEAGRFTIDE
jgi:hypothetical protein